MRFSILHKPLPGIVNNVRVLQHPHFHHLIVLPAVVRNHMMMMMMDVLPRV